MPAPASCGSHRRFRIFTLCPLQSVLAWMDVSLATRTARSMQRSSPARASPRAPEAGPTEPCERSRVPVARPGFDADPGLAANVLVTLLRTASIHSGVPLLPHHSQAIRLPPKRSIELVEAARQGLADKLRRSRMAVQEGLAPGPTVDLPS